MSHLQLWERRTGSHWLNLPSSGSKFTRWDFWPQGASKIYSTSNWAHCLTHGNLSWKFLRRLQWSQNSIRICEVCEENRKEKQTPNAFGWSPSSERFSWAGNCSRCVLCWLQYSVFLPLKGNGLPNRLSPLGLWERHLVRKEYEEDAGRRTQAKWHDCCLCSCRSWGLGRETQIG